ncbi:MAG: hypothetical protein K2O05_01010, partial [Anaeroplasmataceae bacterium]|nr:hypothetical protein [Anaeroplasmataceae bacterium]
ATCNLSTTPDTPVAVQPEHVGTYVGTAGEDTYTVVVTADGITINGDVYTLTAYSDYEGYTGLWNEEEWYLMYYEPNMRLISSDYITNVVCELSTTPDTPVEVQPEHVGTYVGTKDEVTYTIVVTEDGITINGDAYTITEYDEYYGYTGTWNGEVWYLSYTSYSDPVMMTLMDENTTTVINCSLSE